MGVPRNHAEARAKDAHGNALLIDKGRQRAAAAKPVNVDAEYRAKARRQRDVPLNAFDERSGRRTTN